MSCPLDFVKPHISSIFTTHQSSSPLDPDDGQPLGVEQIYLLEILPHGKLELVDENLLKGVEIVLLVEY